MIGARRVLGLIPARGGSKGLPRKNILPVARKPLLAWSIEAAKASCCIDQVVLSSDDDEIIATARAWGCDVPFRRPASLASDEAATIDVVLHALDSLPRYDIVVLLQPTSPLRTAADIDAACALFESRDVPSCVSVSKVDQSPYWMYHLSDNGGLQPVVEAPLGLATRRQDLPDVYALNGAVYVADVDWLRQSRCFLTRESVAYVMPPGRSLDIDSAADFEAFKKTVTEDSHD